MYVNVKEFIEQNEILKVREFLIKQEAVDVAYVIENLDKEYQAIVFRILPKNLAAETFAYLDSDVQKSLILQFSDSELKEMLNKLFVDDAVDIIEEMPSNIVKRLLNNASAQKREQINELLKYPKNSAGSIMTTEYISLKRDMSVNDAIERIRNKGTNSETIYTCYVTDKDRVLTGIVSVKDLLLAAQNTLVGDIMESNFKYVSTTVDRETTAQLISKYGLLAIPVVDFEGRLVGIVTVDDAMEVLNDEVTEDIEAMAAILPSDKPYISTSVISLWLKRVPWLLILMISATFTGAIIRNYENAMQNGYIILTSFIPMLMDTGGNCGSQASVSVIRSISLNEIKLKDIFKVAWKEIRVAFLCGVTLSIANFIKLTLVDRVELPVAGIVCLTLIITVFIAKLVGCILPILAKSIRLDPAVMASPFITTIVDALSLLIYFNIATNLLKI